MKFRAKVEKLHLGYDSYSALLVDNNKKRPRGRDV